MIHSQNSKAVISTLPISVNGASTAEIEVDTLGFDYVQTYVFFGALAEAHTELRMTSSDTSGGTFTAVLTAATDNTIAAATSTFPAADDDNKIWLFEFPTSACKRFVKLESTVASGACLVAALTILSRASGESSLATASERGCEEILRVPVPA